jgi:three-Cys-motif partner protein
VDCFAGPGKFDDGEAGSPIIISKHLQALHEKGIKVIGYFVEKNPELYERLNVNTSGFSFPVFVKKGDFRNYVEEIGEFSKTHTVFVYLDPIKTSHLVFNILESVYNNLSQGQSVETLINFLSTGFLRAVRGLRNNIIENDVLKKNHALVKKWDSIAGGTYWHDIVFPTTFKPHNLADYDGLAEGYREQLSQWFKWRLSYPVREKYNQQPKYHLIFGSRHPDAVELMNRAMVKARREFIKAGFIEGFLFPNQPDKEVIKPEEIKKIIVETSRKLGETYWTKLRLNATIANPSIYTDSEFNRAIKQAIQEGELGSDCPGTKIQENALIWPLS